VIAETVQSSTNTAGDVVLSVQDLSVTFRHGRRSTVKAVDRVSLEIRRGETVGLVGESGSGKSTIGRAILGLQPASSGSIHYAGRDVTRRSSRLRQELSRALQVVFQDPFSSLNPSRTVRRTLAEPLEAARKAGHARLDGEVIARLLDAVGLPADAADRYPHNFSGGQRQRIAIARSLAISPELVVCDEAVSALDLVTRAQIVNLLKDLQAERHLGFLFIAHDLPIVTHMAHRTVVLYRGRVMEQGPAKLVEQAPLHPYTKTLLGAVPVPDPRQQRERREHRLAVGQRTTAAAEEVPDNGCPFAPRCPAAASVCWEQRPRVVRVDQRDVECHAHDPESDHPAVTSTDGTAPTGEDV
jgi:peptide/nickel transport system ATP-binding protein